MPVRGVWAIGWIGVLACLASCTLADVELDDRPCPCVSGYTCVEERCVANGPAGDGDGDAGGGAGTPAVGGGDGDGDALPTGDGDGDAIPAGDGDGDGVVPPPPACTDATCPMCITIAAMLPCCRDDGICGCRFPGTSCN